MEQEKKAAHKKSGDAEIRLKRQLTWIGGTAVVLGNVIGSGIFVTPSSIFRSSGSVGVALLIWCLSGVISMMGGLCYAELSAVLPACGGDYAYIVAAGRSLGRVGDLTAFMCAWSFSTLSDPLSGAIQAQTFSMYALSVAYGGCSPPYSASALVAVTFTCLATALNCVSNKTSSWLQEALSTVKCLILLCIIITAAVSFARGKSQLETPAFSTNVKTSGIVDAFYGSLAALLGWKQVSFIAEEMVDPTRDLQKSLLAGLLVATVIYVLTNLAYAVVLDFATLTSTDAIASAFALRTWGDVGYAAVPVAVSVSVFGMLCASFFSASRFVLAAARMGHLPRMLSLVTIESRVPLTCVIFKGFLAIAYIFFGSIEALIKASVFVETLWDILVMISLLVLRFTMKDRGQSYKAPLVVVLLKLASSVALVIIPLVKPVDYSGYLVIAGVYFIGVLYYLLFVGLRWDCRASRALTDILQKLMLSAPCFDELTFMLDGKKYDVPNDSEQSITDVRSARRNQSPNQSIFLGQSPIEPKPASARQREATTRHPLNVPPANKTYSTMDTTVTTRF